MMPFTGSWAARPGQPCQQQTQTTSAAASSAAAAAVRMGPQLTQALGQGQAMGHQIVQAQATGHQFALGPAPLGPQFTHAPSPQAVGHQFAQGATQAGGLHLAQGPVPAGPQVAPAAVMPPMQPCFPAAPWGAALTPKKLQYEVLKDECSVCVEEEETMHYFATCRHYPFCSKCIENMSLGTPGTLKCPVCRAVVKDVRIIIKVCKKTTQK